MGPNNSLRISQFILPVTMILFLLGCIFFGPSGAGADDTSDDNVEGTLEQAPDVLALGGAESRGAQASSGSAGAANTEPQEEPLPETRVMWEPKNAMPGEPITIGYSYSPGAEARGLQAVLLDSRGRRLVRTPFFSLDTEEEGHKLLAAILPVPIGAGAGEALIRIESGAGTIMDLPFTIDRRDFPSETISLNQENTDLRTLPDPQRTRESEQLWAILSSVGNVIYSGGPFEPPVTSTRRTSRYGHQRVYHYIDDTTDSSIHAGIDFGVPTGTEVKACAAGKVVLARYRILTGYSVVVEHLPAVYSLYYHLDSLIVTEGAIVETGELLGYSGSTGLSTGPHLHWEIRSSGENADPDAFTARPVLDKNDIIGKLEVN